MGLGTNARARGREYVPLKPHSSSLAVLVHPVRAVPREGLWLPCTALHLPMGQRALCVLSLLFPLLSLPGRPVRPSAFAKWVYLAVEFLTRQNSHRVVLTSGRGKRRRAARRPKSSEAESGDQANSRCVIDIDQLFAVCFRQARVHSNIDRSTCDSPLQTTTTG
jgi:hypothetical protein